MSELLTELSEGVLTLTLNRPERRNALSSSLVVALADAVEASAHDPEVRVIVLTGARPAFCAGADLAEMGERWAAGHYARLLQAMAQCGRPVIAKVRGYALAGGVGLVAAAHFALCDDQASFSTPEVHRGIWPMMAMAPLFRLVPQRRGLEMVLLGDRVSAAEAVSMGLVNRAVPADQLDAEVDALARRLVRRPPHAVALGLRAFHRHNCMDYAEALVYLQGMLDRANRTSDAEEGIAAFHERREPSWKE